MHIAGKAVREAGVRYKRHQPEETLLYQIIETYYPDFLDYMESQGQTLPTHITKEFEAYLKCGLLERDMEQSYLTLDEDDDPMGQIQGHSITYRIAVGGATGTPLIEVTKNMP